MGTFILKFVDEKERFLRLESQTLDISLLSGANGEEGKEVMQHFFQQAVEGLPEESEVAEATVARLMLEDCQLGRRVTLTSSVLARQTLRAVMTGAAALVPEITSEEHDHQRGSSFLPVDGPFGPASSRKRPRVPKRPKDKAEGEENGASGSGGTPINIEWTAGRKIEPATSRLKFS